MFVNQELLMSRKSYRIYIDIVLTNMNKISKLFYRNIKHIAHPFYKDDFFYKQKINPFRVDIYIKFEPKSSNRFVNGANEVVIYNFFP